MKLSKVDLGQGTWSSGMAVEVLERRMAQGHTGSRRSVTAVNGVAFEVKEEADGIQAM